MQPRWAEALARDWKKAASFYARWGITEALFRHGVPVEEGHDLGERAVDPLPNLAERMPRAGATFLSIPSAATLT